MIVLPYRGPHIEHKLANLFIPIAVGRRHLQQDAATRIGIANRYDPRYRALVVLLKAYFQPGLSNPAPSAPSLRNHCSQTRYWHDPPWRSSRTRHFHSELQGINHGHYTSNSLESNRY